jgi:hypothetical protein
MIEKTPAIGALAIVLFGGSAFGQQQYDSLGSPMPAPNQQASPRPGPNVPIPGNKSDTNAPATTGTAATDGSGASGKEPASEAQRRSEREGYGPAGGPPDDGRNAKRADPGLTAITRHRPAS